MTGVRKSVTQSGDEYHSNPEYKSTKLSVWQECKRENISKGHDKDIDNAKESPYWPYRYYQKHWQQYTAYGHHWHQLWDILDVSLFTLEGHHKSHEQHNSHINSQANQSQVHEERVDVFIFPQLSKEVCLVYDEAAESNPHHGLNLRRDILESSHPFSFPSFSL